MTGNLLFDALLGPGAPEALAIETAARRYSYRELSVETAKTARALVAVGVSPGDRVAAQVEKSAANLILYLATLRAGAVFLPLNTAYTHSELTYFIADAAPALVVCDPARRESVAAIAGAARVETLDGAGEGSLTDLARTESGQFATVARGQDDLAAICYTSGTTGRSKGAMLTHGALLSNARTLAELWRFTESDVLIHALPIFHVHGLFVATHVVLLTHASMILQPRFDADAVIAAMPRATAFMGVPTFYTRLLAHHGLTRDLAMGMRLFISGSAPLLAQTHEAWRARAGSPILERYGMTETGMNTSNPYDGERIAGSVGPPLPGVALRVVDEGGVVSDGTIGRVEVKGPNLFAGYWRDPEKSHGAFTADGWFKTGDVGFVGPAGYLHLVGREGDLIITGGLNVYPTEVEAAIDALPGVIESAVIGLPHADLGEAVTAVVVTETRRPPSERDVLGALADRLARYKQPRRVLFVSALPRNAMGKVLKAALRQAHYGLFDVGPADARE